MSKPVKKIGGVTVPEELKGKDLLKWMVENKSAFIAEKKSATKHSDAIAIHADINKKLVIDKDGKLTKAATGYSPDMTKVETVLCVINTTNWMDSHQDVHIPGLWKKSIKDNKVFTHLQEHIMKFTNIISDNAMGYTEQMAWKDLGFDSAGMTEALIFASPLTGRNPFMEDQYRKGYVKNHSVGMQYVTLKFCVNDSEDDYFKEEYANWVQYIDQVINKQDAEEKGFFWAVTEAKIVEGSAVPIGSNIITPTIGFKSVEPVSTTQQNQPVQTTDEKNEKIIDWGKIANKILIN